MTRVLRASDEAVVEAVELLAADQTVALPTETVYGLAARAGSGRAVAEVFRVKARPSFDPLIVHVVPQTIDALVERGVLGPIDGEVRGLAAALVARFWPGPLTLVLPKGRAIESLATSGLDRVAVRAPDNPWFARVIDRLGEPLVAPSANRFGRLSPTRAEHVVRELDGLVPLVVDGGPCAVGVESTIVSVERDGLVLLRPGGTPAALIEAATGATLTTRASSARPQAPGMLASHYAPERRLLLADEAPAAVTRGKTIALLTARAWDGRAVAELERRLGCEVRMRAALSPEGDDRIAAQRLFDELRRLDAADVDLLVAELWPDELGLGRAINDRLRRAASPVGTPSAMT